LGQREEWGLIRSGVWLADGRQPGRTGIVVVSEPRVLDGPAVGSGSRILMRKVALLTSLTLAAGTLAGTAGVATAAVADPGSALVVVVVVALGILVIGLLEWTHRRASGVGHAVHGADLAVSAGTEGVRDRDTLRALDELRAARAHQAGPAGPWSAGTPTAGSAHGAVSHALRSV
jgi:hypothetical protein